MTQQAPKRRRPRKPETVLRELRAVLWAIQILAKEDTAPVATSARALELLSELRSSLRYSRYVDGCPHADPRVTSAVLYCGRCAAEKVRASRSQQKGRRP
jgi:hypothetical protein